MPPSNERRIPRFAGPERAILHRATEDPKNYRSTLRSAYVDPKSHENYFPSDGGLQPGLRASARAAEFRAIAEAEAAGREADFQAAKTVGTYDASSTQAMAEFGPEVYGEQKATGKFVRSNAFISSMGVPRDPSITCPAADALAYHEGPAITAHSYRGAVAGEGQLSASFRKKEDKLDHWDSAVWGHGKVGALPQAYGT
jgi:hypothetical protein